MPPWSVRFWQVTADERAARYPCQDHVAPDAELWLRAVDVEASAAHLYRWVCQISVAPYSYDLLDNGGRRSPRTLTPGADDLVVGQPILRVFHLAEVRPGRGLTLVPAAGARRAFGSFALTYEVLERGPDRSRLLASLAVAAHTLPSKVRRRLLQWGDLVMMRKQLLTLKARAEAR